MYKCKPAADGNKVPDRADSEETFHFLENCYRDCLQKHPTCQQISLALPKRVVDISTTPYRLIEPTSGTEGAYAALSYRWSGYEGLTTEGTIEKFKEEGINAKSMPVIFQEMAMVSQRLGIQYLWIDSLCIIQDNELDWSQEAAKMADVFQNASIVIAASSAPNPGTSFLRERAISAPAFIPLKFCGSFEAFKARSLMTCGFHAGRIPEHKDILDHRGWTLQEKELACRWISYSTSEIQWKCKTLRSCECSTIMLPSTSFLSEMKVTVAELYYKWHLLVQEYTSRKLTKQTDRLPALMGLANRFGGIVNTAYLAGLWQQNIIVDLMWKRDWGTEFEPPAQYLAPSFSWASILGGVSYQPERFAYKGSRTYHSELLGARVSGSQSQALSMVQDNWIMLRGPTIEATLSTWNAVDPSAYHLEVNAQRFPSDVHFDGEAGQSGCEFTIDCVVTVPDDLNKNAQGEKNCIVQRAGDNATFRDSFEGRPVKLLSLNTLVAFSRDVVYETFLVFAQHSQSTSAYQRIGLGTGKVYLPTEKRDLLKLNTPFLWTSKSPVISKATKETYVMKNVRIV